MKLRLRRIEPTSLAIVLAKLYFVVGLIGAFFVLLGACFSISADSNISVGKALGLVCLFLVVYPLAGFIGGLLSSWLYNFICRKGDGIDLEFDRLDQIERRESPTQE